MLKNSWHTHEIKDSIFPFNIGEYEAHRSSQTTEEGMYVQTSLLGLSVTGV